jgi:hypothetical protein
MVMGRLGKSSAAAGPGQPPSAATAIIAAAAARREAPVFADFGGFAAAILVPRFRRFRSAFLALLGDRKRSRVPFCKRFGAATALFCFS